MRIMVATLLVLLPLFCSGRAIDEMPWLKRILRHGVNFAPVSQAPYVYVAPATTTTTPTTTPTPVTIPGAYGPHCIKDKVVPGGGALAAYGHQTGLMCTGGKQWYVNVPSTYCYFCHKCALAFYGTAPFCDGECPAGWTQLGTSDYGNGAYCATGSKVLCMSNSVCDP